MAANSPIALRARCGSRDTTAIDLPGPRRDTVHGITDQGVNVLPYTFSVTNIELSRRYPGRRILLICSRCSISRQYGRYPVEIYPDPRIAGMGAYSGKSPAYLPRILKPGGIIGPPPMQPLPGSESARPSIIGYPSARTACMRRQRRRRDRGSAPPRSTISRRAYLQGLPRGGVNPQDQNAPQGASFEHRQVRAR